ncbi:transporter substrate-binding domain-containing protein [Bengtsoniella intestinalis]
MKKLFAALMAMTMTLSLAACSSSTTEATTTTESTAAETTTEAAAATDMEYVVDNGVLVVGITNFEPMDYPDANGEWIGFDADMARGFADYLGVDIEFVEIEWSNKILELNAKTIDCVWNGMTLTEEVMSAMGTSNAYCNNAQVVVMKADTAAKYDEPMAEADFFAFAAEDGSAGDAELSALGYNVTLVQDQATALMEVAAGTADACAIDLLMAGAMIGEGTSYADMVMVGTLNSEEYGVGFRTDSDLVDAINAFFSEAYADGSMMEIAETYGVDASILAQ